MDQKQTKIYDLSSEKRKLKYKKKNGDNLGVYHDLSSEKCKLNQDEPKKEFKCDICKKAYATEKEAIECDFQHAFEEKQTKLTKGDDKNINS